MLQEYRMFSLPFLGALPYISVLFPETIPIIFPAIIMKQVGKFHSDSIDEERVSQSLISR